MYIYIYVCSGLACRTVYIAGEILTNSTGNWFLERSKKKKWVEMTGAASAYMIV